MGLDFKVVIAHRIHQSVHQVLDLVGPLTTNDTAQPWDIETLARHCAGARALMVFMTEVIDDGFLERCPDLQVIAGALKGYNNIDVAACTQRGVLVTNVPDLLTAPTAELTIGLMIGLARHIVRADQSVRAGGFQGWRPDFYGGSLNGATVGVIGAGAVGKSVLRMLGGFDCRCLYFDKKPITVEEECELSAQRVSLEALQSQSDFVVLAVHLMPETHHMVNASFLGRMKPGAYLVNPARGSVVDEAAVVEALGAGHLAGYAADTHEMEDWVRDDGPHDIPEALLASDKTILTPHIGSAVAIVREAIERSAAESILAVRDGLVPATAVNPEARC